MERHASESYYVPGEGLLAVSAGGRDSAPAATPFRCSRMGPRGGGLDDRTTELLAAAMAAGGGSGVEQTGVPAGYTYLGQFIAHDLSFDKTAVTLGANVSPAQLLQGTSPSLDLDSLYGAGPEDPASARFYAADAVHLKTGRTLAAGGRPEAEGFDLPRGAGSTVEERRTAVIPDERNDDNLAVAQTHLAFIRFHNRVVDSLPASVPDGLRFARARELVTKHYQWMVRTDYLPRICAQPVLDDVFENGRKVFEAGAEASAVPTMPLEFSVGTFRLGHSMVRSHYSWNRLRDTVTLRQLFESSAKGGDLGGHERLPSTMIADLRRLYDFGGAGRPDLAVPPAKLNLAMRIDTRLVARLRKLPPETFGGTDVPRGDPRANLAFRNLSRARMVKLAGGPQMADFLSERGVTLTRLSRAQLLEGENGAGLDGFTADRESALVEHAPLWFYILREAECNGGRLDGVGARIVAETFHRAIEGSRWSIVRDPDWRPTLGPDATRFGMAELLLFAFEENPQLLAPLER